MLKEYRESPEKFAEMKYALAAHMADPSADDCLGMLFMVDLVEYIGQEKYHHSEDASKSAHHFVTLSQEKATSAINMHKLMGSMGGNPLPTIWHPVVCPKCGDKAFTSFAWCSPLASFTLEHWVAQCKECGHCFYAADAVSFEDETPYAKTDTKEAQPHHCANTSTNERLHVIQKSTSPVSPHPTSPPDDTPQIPIASKTTDLTDDGHWFSIKYKGFASRGELLGMTAILFVLSCCKEVLGRMLEMSGMELFALFLGILLGIFNLLFILSCMCRRSIQMSGTVAWGWSIFILNIMANSAFNSGSLEIGYLLLGAAFVVLLILVSVKGTYAGKKNDLMRAAILGNVEEVKELTNKYDIEQKSEMGYTAREYAEKKQHSNIATYLRGLENNVHNKRSEHSHKKTYL